MTRERVLIMCFLAALVGLGGHAAAAEALTLAEGGQALLPLALDTSVATPVEVTAAEELRAYLSRISGAEFEIVETTALAPGTPAIYVGVTRFGRGQGVEPAQLGPEQSVLKTAEGSLIVSGGRPRGTLYAVYELLDEVLGVRWYTPWYEHVPSTPTLTLPALDRRFRPYFMYRENYNNLADPRIYADNEGWTRFTVRNRLNGRGPGEEWGGGMERGRAGNHSFAQLVPADKYFDEHPEYFSERKGERVRPTSVNGHHLCLTNPDVLRIVIEEVKQDFVNYPRAFYVSVSINDGGLPTICDCEPCRRVAEAEGESGLLMQFVNQVADAIKDDYPDKYLLTLAYNPTAQPPKRIRARDNVIVFVCTGGRSALVHYPQGMEAKEYQVVRDWSQFAQHVWQWDYANSVFRGMHFFRPVVWQMYDQFQLYRSLATVDGIMQENEFLGGNDVLFRQFYEMDLWIFTRLCRDPAQPLEPLIRDFLEGYYGPAAPVLLEYVELLHSRRTRYPYRWFDWDFAREMQQCLEAAEAAVGGDPELLERVRDLRLNSDLALAAWRNDILHDYLAQGNELADYPFPLETLRQRLLQRLEETQHPYLQARVPRWHEIGEDWRVTFDPALDGLREYVEVLSSGKEYAPLPEQFAALPPERIIDLTGATFARNTSVGPDLFADEEAALGLVWQQLSEKELPLAIGVWSADKERPLHLIIHVREDEVPGPGYNWYKGPRFTLREWCYVYLTWSWRFQLPLWTEYDPAHPDQEWEVWVSAKLDGPAYPHGSADAPNGLRVDRVILVQVPPGS